MRDSPAAPVLAGASGRRGDRVAMLVATVGGVGYAPVAPGTVGSAVAAVLLWLIPFSNVGLVFFLLAVTSAGLWASHRVERVLEVRDPAVIVIDEVAGLTLALLAGPRTLPVVVVAFLLFRVFDVLKPFPARAAERLPGGAGAMADDLVAGLYTLAALLVLEAVARWL
jgi:phosphatidylglycerophosphatase A